MTHEQLTIANNKLINKNFSLQKKIEKIQKKLNRKGAHLPLQIVWKLKDLNKARQHKILINEQQVRFNLMLKLNINKPNQN